MVLPSSEVNIGYGPSDYFRPSTVIPVGDARYNGKVALVQRGVFFEYLVSPSQGGAEKLGAIPLLAIHTKGCAIGTQYGGEWPADVHLDTVGGTLSLPGKIVLADYFAESQQQARSSTESVRLSLKSAEARIVAGIYLLSRYDAAYTAVVRRVMGVTRETVSRTVTRLTREGVVSKTSLRGAIKLRDGALQRYSLSEEELSDLVHGH